MTKKEHRALLTAKLRDGSFAQIEGRLRDHDNGRCCLGVACDVFHEVTGIGQWQDRGDGTIEFVVDRTAMGYDAWGMPEDVRVWYGFASSDGVYLGGCLIDHNDAHGKSFPEIADIIEAEPVGLVEQV